MPALPAASAMALRVSSMLVPIVMNSVTPAALARASTASIWSNSGAYVRWQCESITVVLYRRLRGLSGVLRVSRRANLLLRPRPKPRDIAAVPHDDQHGDRNA